MRKLFRTITLILTALFVWSLCLAKYLDPRSGIAIKNADQLSLKLPYVPHIWRFLNGCEYHLTLSNTCAVVFILILLYWRLLTLKKSWMSPQ